MRRILKEKLKEFMKLKQCNGYKIGDEDIVCNSYPEDYDFIRKENSKWIYGESHRDEEKKVKEFYTEEEALLALVYILYTGSLQIMLKEDYVIKSIDLKDNEKIKFIESIFSKEELHQLKIKNNRLLYHDKYLIENYLDKYNIEIEQFYFLSMFDLKAFEQTRRELIEFGVDPAELDKYFRFENLVNL